MSKVTLYSIATLGAPEMAYPSAQFKANDKASMLGLYAFGYGQSETVVSRGLLTVSDSSVTFLAVRDALG